MTKTLSFLFSLFIFTTFLSAPVFAQEDEILDEDERPIVQENNVGTLSVDTLRGTITAIGEEEKELFGSKFMVKVYKLEVKEDGEIKEIEVIDQNRPEFQNVKFEVGDKVFVDKAVLGNEITYVITDFQRGNALILLIAIFVVLVVLIARKQGLYSLIGLAVSYIIIVEVLLKQILNGTDPFVAAILASIIIIPVNYYLAHGRNAKTTYAAISTIVTLIIVGILSLIFVELAKLSGFTSDEAGFISSLTNGAVNIKDLLLGGIIIGTLGILDDITISQASIAHQLKASKPDIKFNELWNRTLAIGRDHIASLVNTLILVYTSASLPLLLLFINAESDFFATMNREVIAEEIIVMLLSSIGLILAVPISTLLTCYFIDKRGVKADAIEDGHDHEAHGHLGHHH